MKKHSLLTFIFFSYTLFSFSQSGTEVALVYGRSTGSLFPSILRSGFVMGTGSHSLNNGNSFGIRYFSYFSGKERMGYEKHLFLHEESGLNEFGIMLGLGYKF